MQHHIIRLISVNLSNLGPEYFTNLLKFDDVECFDGWPSETNELNMFFRHILEVMLAFFFFCKK